MKAGWWQIKGLEHWRRRLRRSWHRISQVAHLGHQQLPRLGLNPLAPLPGPLPNPEFVSLPQVPPVRQRRQQRGRRDRLKAAVAICLAAIVLATALGQRFYRQPELRVETVAPTTISAPRDASIEDRETTEADRTAARTGAKPVLVPNPAKNARIQIALDKLIDQATLLRQQAGEIPFLPTDQLSTNAQTYLRQATAEEWETIRSLSALDSPNNPPALEQLRQAGSPFRQLLPRQQQAVRELLVYRQSRTPADRNALVIQIENVRSRYRQTRQDLKLLAAAEGQTLSEDSSFLDLSDADWETTKQGLRRALHRMLLQGIAQGIPSDILQEASKLQVRHTVPPAAEGFAMVTLASVLEVNLEPHPERTRQKAEDAAQQVPPAMVNIKAGEIIVREGEIIDRSAFVLLDEFNLSQRRLNRWGLFLFALFITVGIGLFLLAERHVRPALRRCDYGLVLCMVLGMSGLNVLGVAVYSLPAIGLLLGSFYGGILGTTVVGLVAIAFPLGTHLSTIPLIASATGAVVSSMIAPRLRSREELALLGIVAGLFQAATYLILTWVLNPFNQVTWYFPITEAAKQGGYGLVSSILALGLSPYLEHVFDLVTPIRLAELSNPNRPLLKRLSAEAPGTFQHTVFVASLAEAAAKALNCNVELVRAGTLYHDIGKMHDPQGFIENQMGGPNKHDTLNDPWHSASIIKKHVSEGLVMARRCRLPKALQAFIPEHQGTMLISYFYHQAQKQVESSTLDPINFNTPSPVQEMDFRYDGPIPQSPETGIVMLADSCEAALRSLKDATHEEALAMVNRILKARWRDQQLIDSGLTREHMALIAQVFVQVWEQYNHKRIAYPQASLRPIMG
ncbi:HD family phosphohydrolase [Leptolyngbya sp. PCC 6406]|uniref:HD family phosphohydrolase n=1 Tax=Leptolyngbya sp. PCC 6406 TaxID=1173264 RepID=UPI0002AC3CB5|nr:HDIG domain-containing metalloprotein [Leptolyngbya sp. PCC 6406]